MANLQALEMDVFFNQLQVLTDGASVHWMLFLGKHGKGPLIYKEPPGQPAELVAAPGTYYMGAIFEGGDGRLYHRGATDRGEFITSAAIPGWTSTKP